MRRTVLGIVAYILIGFLVARYETMKEWERSRVDMREMAFVVVIAWPAFVALEAVALLMPQEPE